MKKHKPCPPITTLGSRSFSGDQRETVDTHKSNVLDYVGDMFATPGFSQSRTARYGKDGFQQDAANIQGDFKRAKTRMAMK